MPVKIYSGEITVSYVRQSSGIRERERSIGTVAAVRARYAAVVGDPSRSAAAGRNVNASVGRIYDSNTRSRSAGSAAAALTAASIGASSASTASGSGKACYRGCRYANRSCARSAASVPGRISVATVFIVSASASSTGMPATLVKLALVA